MRIKQIKRKIKKLIFFLFFKKKEYILGYFFHLIFGKSGGIFETFKDKPSIIF